MDNYYGGLHMSELALASTATDFGNFALIGAGLIVVAAIVFIVSKKKR